MNKNKFAYNKHVAEIIGTLILALVVALSGSGLSVIIFAGIAYAFMVYLFGGISGAHINPAFTIAALTLKKIKWQDAILYICSQLIGAGIALIILKNVPNFTFTDIKSLDITNMALFRSEIIGAIIFAMAFSAFIHGKTTKSNSGFIVGVGLFFGLLFANIAGGIGLLNPAVAVGTNLLSWATILGSIVGAVVGAWAYRFIAFGSFNCCDSSDCNCAAHNHSKDSDDSEPVVVVVESVGGAN